MTVNMERYQQLSILQRMPKGKYKSILTEISAIPGDIKEELLNHEFTGGEIREEHGKADD